MFDEKISIKDMFYLHVLPKMKTLSPDKFSEYTWEHFGNISRTKNGLDNRRRKDKNFLSCGEKIKQLTNKTQNSWKSKSFEQNVHELALAIINYTINETKSKKVLKKKSAEEIDNREEIYIGPDGSEIVISK